MGCASSKAAEASAPSALTDPQYSLPSSLVDAEDPHVEAELAAIGLKVADRQRYLTGEACCFNFVLASKLREHGSAWPNLRTLRRDHTDWLVSHTIRIGDVLTGSLRNYLIVSHRWELPGLPDERGDQSQALCMYLGEHPEFEFVWMECAH